jgi:urease accessory protein
MRRAIEHFAAGSWPKGREADSLTLAFDDRHRRRYLLKSDAGAPVLLDLAKAVAMADDDGLRCDDGQWLAVHAAAETLAEIACADPSGLARIAWHLGNRHLPTQLYGDRLRIRPDHVIEAMVRGLGATVRPVTAPFQPEGGAYASGERAHSHGQDGLRHHHYHEHDHAH